MSKAPHKVLECVKRGILLVLISVLGINDLCENLFQIRWSFWDLSITDLRLLVVGNYKSGAVKRRTDFQLFARLHRLGRDIQRKRLVLKEKTHS